MTTRDAQAEAAGSAASGEAELRVLVVDDDEVDRRIVRRNLARAGVRVRLDDASTAYEALERVAGGEYDCVFLDYNIPGGDGLTLLRGIKGAGLDLPVIMLTGQGDEQVAVELMKAGAADYLPKSALTPERLAQSLRHAVELARAAAATRQAEAQRAASAARTARLQEVTAQLATALSTDDVARLFVTQLREALGAATAWIAVRAGHGAALNALASVGFDPASIGRFDRIPLDAPGPSSDIMRDGRARFFATRADLLAAYPSLTEAAAVHEQEAVAILPLDVGGEPMGVMTLGFRTPRGFPAEDRAFALALARQCAQALERARLYELERHSRAEAERLAARLATAALAITRQPSLDSVLREITEQARAIVGAHQAVTSVTAGETQDLFAVSFSDRYAKWRDYQVPPDGSGIYRLVVRDARPMRMTQAELEAHSAWRHFGAERDRHPPMRGWLAAPLVGADATVLGLIQLSDKYEGEFSAGDESILVQLAQMAAAAIENAQLFAAAQAARAEAEEANRAKSEFLARMSHDLRTPLNAIGGYAQLLQMGIHGPVTEAQIEDIGRIQRAQQHLLTLINDLLSFARLEAGQVRVEGGAVAIREVLLELGALVRPEAERRGITLQIEPGSAPATARGDAERLMQVLTNLTSNALKFTPAGGWVRVDYTADAERVDIRVADTGVGIPAERMEAIFDPFVQGRDTTEERREGVGLGLAISRELTRLMGGDLRVESTEGKGSVFTVRLALGGSLPGGE